LKRWTALVPVKQGPETKSRLSDLLDLPARTALATAMAEHVVSCLGAVDAIEAIHVLSPAPVRLEGVTWMADGGAGLNCELDRAAASLPDGPLLVIHGDLPFLQTGNLVDLLSAAVDTGVAIAPDRHERGTNAVALTGTASGFAFGPDSLRLHLGRWPNASIVRQRGLVFDLDTRDDLVEAGRFGVPWTEGMIRHR
jgi:2-phospho-L-lactate guanylyltransferase